MKRLVLLCVLAATLASVSSAAAAAVDAVNGAGALNAQFTFSVAAQSGPAGENPSGSVVFNDLAPGFGVRQGDVSQGCLIVSGNRAIVVGLLPHSQWLFADGRVFRWLGLWVQDNGPASPGHPHRSVDQAAAIYLSDSAKASACAGGFRPMTPLTAGDVSVIDG